MAKYRIRQNRKGFLPQKKFLFWWADIALAPYEFIEGAENMIKFDINYYKVIYTPYTPLGDD